MFSRTELTMSTDANTQIRHKKTGGTTARPPRRRLGPVALAVEFERHNPFQTPDWRWRLAARLVSKTKRVRPGRADPLVARALRFQNRLARCHTPGRLAQLRRAEPDLFQAWEMHASGGWPRVLVEARFLSTMPADEISSRTGMTAGAVDLYGALFFDVAARLRARDYIVHLIGSPEKAKNDYSFAERQIKSFAYFMGPLVLDHMAETVFDGAGNMRQDELDLATEDGRFTARLRLAVMAGSPGKSFSYLLEILRSLERIRQFESRRPHQAVDPGQILADCGPAASTMGQAWPMESAESADQLPLPAAKAG
jgi:hypothetical protein